MNSLEKANLERWCRKRSIDTAYIDSSITYAENVKLLSEKTTDVQHDWKGFVQHYVEDMEKKLAREQERVAYWKWRALRAENKNGLSG